MLLGKNIARDLCGRVVRAVVDDNQFAPRRFAIKIRNGRAQRFPKPASFVIRWNDDRDGGQHMGRETENRRDSAKQNLRYL